MRISEIMTRDVALAKPDDIIIEVARRMTNEDIGFLPVGENDRLVGMVTDRDIVTRRRHGSRRTQQGERGDEHRRQILPRHGRGG